MTKPPLFPLRFRPMPLGSIRPEGWLRRQLRIQADGLTGRLDEFWPDIADSGWIGGAAEGWERAPYWLDGLVPLAFLLGDAHLISKVGRWADHILDHQQEDGWLGPNPGGRWDTWPIFIVLKVFAQLHEAAGDARLVPAMMRACRKIDEVLDRHPLSSWAAFRWQDLVWCLYWLHERAGDDWLLWLADRAARQGYDWASHFADLPFKERQAKWTFDNHVVNHAMALKAAAMLYRRSGRPDHAALAWDAIETMDRYHGQATGMFSGDESLAGRMPSQGTELCAVVETMFSLSTNFAVLGDIRFADRLEKIAFNALPATLKPDMWAHQYDQQVNQVVCKISQECLYTSNGSDANIYGLEPNFGCCTANMHQGWPKLVSHLWMLDGNDGLVSAAYAPCDVTTAIGGVPVRLTVATDYPFDDVVEIGVAPERPADFSLSLRIPAWCRSPSVEVGGAPAEAGAGPSFCRLRRTWEGETRVRLRLPMPWKIADRTDGAVAVERGPLLYALAIGEEWRRIHEDVAGRELPHGDWEVHPTTPWNYALALDRNAPDSCVRFEALRLVESPFSPESAPVAAFVRGRRLPSWGLERNAAAAPPRSPVASSEPEEELRLLPYGCTNLRVGEFPVLG